MKFHEILRQRRLALGLTQEQLAEKIGVSNKTISKWENEKNMPDYSMIEPPAMRFLLHFPS